MTNSEFLTQIDTAIQNILAGGNQSYSFNGRSFTKLNVLELWKLRQEVAALVAEENTGANVAFSRITFGGWES